MRCHRRSSRTRRWRGSSCTPTWRSSTTARRSACFAISTCGRTAEGPIPFQQYAHRERRVVAYPVDAVHDAPAADLTRVPHADALHHGTRPRVVADRAGHHGVYPEDVEREREPGEPHLGRVPAPPELAPHRPADLHPVRVRDERIV